MSVHHRNPPKLPRPKSNAFTKNVTGGGPFSEEPPLNRPRYEKKRTLAVMTAQHTRAWTEQNLESLLMFTDEIVLEDIEAELDHERFEWTLDEEFNVPLCDGKKPCGGTCERYRHHLVSRLCQEDPDIVEESDEETSDEDGDHSMHDAAEDAMQGCKEKIEPKSKCMMKLLRAQALRARKKAFEADGDERAKGQMEGMIASLQTEKLRADAERDRANVAWSNAQMELQKAQKSLSYLTGSNDELKHDLQSARAEIQNLNDKLAAALAAAKWQCPDRSAATWATMSKPTPKDPPELLACWLQFYEDRKIPGIPFHQTFEGITKSGPVSPSTIGHRGGGDRSHRLKRFYAMIKLLGVPGEYARLIGIHNYAIAARQSHSTLILGQDYTDEKVAQLLAAQGMTLKIADDVWQYCYNVIQSEVENHPSDGQITDTRHVQEFQRLLSHSQQLLSNKPRPAGLNPPEQDQFERPATLPRKRSR
ncbi:hypothetical protein C8R47DRAFT_1066107 [Mycena vitilis]|nr:hypothetical protein C8R47DRAFT_1066107 [Mycena vitilis]